MRSPILNPIRFYRTDKLSDWNTYFPNPNNIQHRQEMFIGISPALYYKEFLANKDIKLQFEVASGDDTILYVYKYNELNESYELSSTVTGSDITPIGWVGNSIYSYTKALTEGTYYFQINTYLKSDIFTVISDSFLNKKIVKVEYSNTENDYGCIFDNFTFTNYFSGILDVGQPDNEIEAFESDYGDLTKLSSIPKRVATLTISDIHKSLIDHVTMIFSVDTILVNGISYQNNEVPSVQDRENSDIVDITIKLTQTSNDYYYE